MSKTPSFNFEKQFDSSVEFYKSQMVLRQLSEKIGLAELWHESDDPEKVVEFCNRHNLSIVGVDVKKNYSTGGDMLSDELVAKLIEERTGMKKSDGRIIAYSIIDNELEIASKVYVLHDPSEPFNNKTLTEDDLRKLLSGYDYENYSLDGNEQAHAGKELEIVFDSKTPALSRSVVKVFTNRNPEWDDVDFIPRPENEKENEWILNNKEVREYMDQGLALNLILRMNHSSLQKELDYDSEKLEKITEFNFPLNGELLYYMQDSIDDDYMPEVICLNCLSTTVSAGDMVACVNCGSTTEVMFYDEEFPVDEEVIKEVREYLAWLTGVSEGVNK